MKVNINIMEMSQVFEPVGYTPKSFMKLLFHL